MPYRRGPHHAEACGPNGVSLLHRPTTTASSSSVGASGAFQLPDAQFGACLDPAELYANSVLVDLPAYLVQRLYSALIASARLISMDFGDTATCQTRSSRFTG
jgi:hypothetical protein